MKGQVLSFGIAGAIGFAVDAGVLTLLVHYAGLSPAVARIGSFACAVLATWWINRTRTFKAAAGSPRLRPHQELPRYVLVQCLGACLNYAVFMSVLYLVPATQALPVAALAVASGVAMFFNFFASRWFVFRAKPAAR